MSMYAMSTRMGRTQTGVSEGFQVDVIYEGF